ncbi:DNA-binding protein [Russula earlei]|uniref:DNA-binding protein n=1 Tax=Russula earlei TaxID=71964 RepID=A0ACC0UN85_9AGAM|nr:DNA-binding protein [Russula earlei]
MKFRFALDLGDGPLKVWTPSKFGYPVRAQLWTSSDGLAERNLGMSSQGTLTFNQAVRGITEFIEVAVHTILYVRQVYPADIFVRRKKYETPVYQSRHPGLNEYISGAVKAIGDELVLGDVEKVVVVIKDKDEVALERFIFSIQTMIAIESFNKNTSVEGAMATTALGQYFRSFMVKLSMIESQLAELPRDGVRSYSYGINNARADSSGGEITFAIVLELQEGKVPSAMPDKDDPPPWLPAVTQHTTSGASEKAELHMVRAVDTGVVNLSLAVQESADKLRILAASKGEQISAHEFRKST